VGDAVLRVLVRQVRVVRVAAEGKLKDAHSGEAELVAQGVNVGRYSAEVFGDDRQFAIIRTLQSAKHLAPRSIDPATALGGLVPGWHFPEGREAAEVVE